MALVNENNPVIEKLKEWLAEHYEIELAILFGSYVKERETNLSDIDLAVSLNNRNVIGKSRKLEYLYQLSSLLGKDVDLVDLNTVGQPLLSQIIKYGRCVKGSLHHYAEMALKNINTTQDFMPYLERMLSERRERWLNDG